MTCPDLRSRAHAARLAHPLRSFPHALRKAHRGSHPQGDRRPVRAALAGNRVFQTLTAAGDAGHVDEPDLAQRWLASEELLLALPDHHPAAGATRVALADVADEPFVLPEQHDVPGLHAAVHAAFADAGVTPHIAQRGVWLMQTVLGLVAAGIGLAIVPASVAALNRAGVVLRHLDGAGHRVDLAAVWRPDSTSAPLARMLAAIRTDDR